MVRAARLLEERVSGQAPGLGMKLPPMNRGSICWVRMHVLGMTFDKAHRWRVTFDSGPTSAVYDAVVCEVCGVNGWINRGEGSDGSRDD
jgi:hypothetical protein